MSEQLSNIQIEMDPVATPCEEVVQGEPVMEHLRALLICHKAFQCMVQAPMPRMGAEKSNADNNVPNDTSKKSISPATVRKSLQNVFIWCSDTLKVVLVFDSHKFSFPFQPYLTTHHFTIFSCHF